MKRRRLLAGAAICPAVVAAAPTFAATGTMQLLQWLHTRLVQPNTTEMLEGPNGFTWASEVFPYTVPAGHVLGIIDAQMGSKMTSTGRGSYFVVSNVLSLPDNAGHVSFRVPLAVPAGATFTGSLINNDEVPQWMTSAMTGILVPHTGPYREAFTFLFP